MKDLNTLQRTYKFKIQVLIWFGFGVKTVIRNYTNED